MKLPLLFFVLASFAQADAIYTYTGTDFTLVTGTGGPTTSDYISLSFEVADPIPASVFFFPLDLLSWSMNDGVNFLSSQDPNDDVFGFPSITTDANGNIVAWNLDAQSLVPPGNNYGAGVTLATSPGVDQSVGYLGPYGEYSTPTWADSTSSIDIQDGIPGTWTEVVTTTPEPSYVWLCGIGLLAVVIRRTAKVSIIALLLSMIGLAQEPPTDCKTLPKSDQKADFFPFLPSQYEKEGKM